MLCSLVGKAPLGLHFEDSMRCISAGEEYQLEKALKNNELRALLTMEAGIHPVPWRRDEHDRLIDMT